MQIGAARTTVTHGKDHESMLDQLETRPFFMHP